MAKKLYRPQDKKMIAGVCAGLADYFEIDVTVVRLVLVLLALITAIVPFMLFYIIAWIIIPSQPVSEQSQIDDKSAKH